MVSCQVPREPLTASIGLGNTCHEPGIGEGTSTAKPTIIHPYVVFLLGLPALFLFRDLNCISNSQQIALMLATQELIHFANDRELPHIERDRYYLLQSKAHKYGIFPDGERDGPFLRLLTVFSRYVGLVAGARQQAV